jgi:hypothetical protein
MTLDDEIKYLRSEYNQAEIDMTCMLLANAGRPENYFNIKRTAERLAHCASVLSKSLEEKEQQGKQ